MDKRLARILGETIRPRRTGYADAEEFAGYPEKQVLAAFETREAAAAALNDAIESGIPQGELSIYSGEEGAEEIDSTGTQHGITGVLRRSVEFFMTDRDRLSEYQEAVERGGVVLAAMAENDDRKHELSAIFKRHEGHDVRYFGTMTVEELSVDPSRVRGG